MIHVTSSRFRPMIQRLCRRLHRKTEPMRAIRPPAGNCLACMLPMCPAIRWSLFDSALLARHPGGRTPHGLISQGLERALLRLGFPLILSAISPCKTGGKPTKFVGKMPLFYSNLPSKTFYQEERLVNGNLPILQPEKSFF